MIYLITDTHLGHRNMIKNCGRPERFTDIIFDNCRKIVKRDDLLIHLGDIAWNEANLQRFLKLPGRKILVRGSHDKKSTPYYLDAGFTLVVDQMAMTRRSFDQHLGKKIYATVQFPWDDARFFQSYRIVDQKAEQIRSEGSGFPSDMMLCWFQVESMV